MNFPGEVGDVVANVSYDGTGFAKFPAVSQGRQHDTADSLVATTDPYSLVG